MNERVLQEAEEAVSSATDELDRLRASNVDGAQIREAERALKQARRRLMYTRVGATERSDYLEDTGAPPGSHEKKA